jgi:hypothetical protein
LAFVPYLCVAFLNTTMTKYYYPAALLTATGAFATVLTAIKLVVCDRFRVGRLAAFAALIGTCLVVNHVAQFRQIAFLGVLMVAAHGVPFRRIVRTFLAVTVPLLAGVTLMSLVGIIPNLYYPERNRYALGAIYPTDYAAHCFFTVCAYLWYIARPPKKLDYLILAVPTLIALFVCRSRVDSVCIVAAIAAILLLARWPGLLRRGLSQIVVLVVGPLTGAVINAGSWFYSPSDPILAKLNVQLSDRLRLGQDALTKYPLTLFGQMVEMNGYGGQVVVPWWLEYFYIDSSYLWALLRCGVVFTALAVVTAFVVQRRALRQGDISLAIILAVVYVNSAIALHLFEIAYNVFLLALFAATSSAAVGRSTNPAADLSGPTPS